MAVAAEAKERARERRVVTEGDDSVMIYRHYKSAGHGTLLQKGYAASSSKITMKLK